MSVYETECDGATFGHGNAPAGTSPTRSIGPRDCQSLKRSVSADRRVGARRARRGMLHGHILVGSFLGQHAHAFGRGVDGG